MNIGMNFQKNLEETFSLLSAKYMVRSAHDRNLDGGGENVGQSPQCPKSSEMTTIFLKIVVFKIHPQVSEDLPPFILPFSMVSLGHLFLTSRKRRRWPWVASVGM